MENSTRMAVHGNQKMNRAQRVSVRFVPMLIIIMTSNLSIVQV